MPWIPFLIAVDMVVSGSGGRTVTDVGGGNSGLEDDGAGVLIVADESADGALFNGARDDGGVKRRRMTIGA